MSRLSVEKEANLVQAMLERFIDVIRVIKPHRRCLIGVNVKVNEGLSDAYSFDTKRKKFSNVAAAEIMVDTTDIQRVTFTMRGVA